MGKLIVSTQTTVDGVITTDKWYIHEGDHEQVGFDQLVAAEAVLLGRKTFVGLAEYWAPLSGENEPTRSTGRRNSSGRGRWPSRSAGMRSSSAATWPKAWLS